MRIHTIELPHLHTGCIALAMRGGPRYEGVRERGLTHFLEHAMLRGAGKYPTTRAMMAAFEELGGEPDAFTGEDSIIITFEFAPGHLAAAGEILATILLEPNYVGMEHERDLILEERLEEVNEEGETNALDQMVSELVYGEHPISRPILGQAGDIEAVTIADLERWRQQLVRTDNVAVAVAGPVTAGDVEAALAPLSRLPPGPALTDSVPLITVPGPRVSLMPQEGPQTELLVAFPGPGEAEVAYPALEVLAGILDGGPTTRVAECIMDTGIAYSAGVSLTSVPESSILSLELAVGRDKVGRALDAMLSLIDGLCTKIGEDEMGRAAVRRRHAARRRLDHARGWAEWASRRLLFGLSLDVEKEDRAHETLQADEIVRAARNLFRRDGLVAVVQGGRPGKQEQAAKRRLLEWSGPATA